MEGMNASFSWNQILKILQISMLYIRTVKRKHSYLILKQNLNKVHLVKNSFHENKNLNLIKWYKLNSVMKKISKILLNYYAQFCKLFFKKREIWKNFSLPFLILANEIKEDYLWVNVTKQGIQNFSKKN